MAYQLYYEGKFKYHLDDAFSILTDFILQSPRIRFRMYQDSEGDLLGTNHPFRYVTMDIYTADNNYPVIVRAEYVNYAMSSDSISHVCNNELQVLSYITSTAIPWLQSKINHTATITAEIIASGVIEYENFSMSGYEDYFELYNDTIIYGYKLNCEKNRLNKGVLNYLLPDKNITGYFREFVDIMNPQIKVEEYDSYNYVYIPSLKRYYFVTNVIKNTKGLTTLYLHEDVLYSNKDLILLQSAYVTRSASNGSENVIDDLSVMDYDKNFAYTTITPTTDIFNVDEKPSTLHRPAVILTVVMKDLYS